MACVGGGAPANSSATGAKNRRDVGSHLAGRRQPEPIFGNSPNYRSYRRQTVVRVCIPRAGGRSHIIVALSS